MDNFKNNLTWSYISFGYKRMYPFNMSCLSGEELNVGYEDWLNISLKYRLLVEGSRGLSSAFIDWMRWEFNERNITLILPLMIVPICFYGLLHIISLYKVYFLSNKGSYILKWYFLLFVTMTTYLEGLFRPIGRYDGHLWRWLGSEFMDAKAASPFSTEVFRLAHFLNKHTMLKDTWHYNVYVISMNMIHYVVLSVHFNTFLQENINIENS